jgi:hypothetical protein
MNTESATNVLTRQWRIATYSETVTPRNRMPETGASGSVGAPLEQSEGATRQRFPLRTTPIYSVLSLSSLPLRTERSPYFIFDCLLARSSLSKSKPKGPKLFLLEWLLSNAPKRPSGVHSGSPTSLFSSYSRPRGMTLIVADRARAPIIGLRYELARYFAR